MDRSNVITLISQTETMNEYGVMIPSETSREVFCDVTSVSQSEFFEGSRSGLRPEYRVVMFRYDYEGEQIAKIDGTRYTIYRTYIARNDDIELYMEKRKGNADAGA